jgi:hypothetical protein
MRFEGYRVNEPEGRVAKRSLLREIGILYRFDHINLIQKVE